MINMSGRIPLSIVFGAASRRDCVPHRTFAKPLSDSSFFNYLNSDDTRLPRHRLLDLTPLPVEEYDTFTGEDDWLGPNVITSTMSTSNEDDDNDDNNNKEKNTRSHNGKTRTQSDSNARVRFDEVVQWVAETLEMSWACGDDSDNDNSKSDDVMDSMENTTINKDCNSTSHTSSKNDNGVVLCGKYVVADDCPWAVSSRSVQLYTVREVFTAMRSSCKFMRDIEHQLVSAQRQSERRLQINKWREKAHSVRETCSNAKSINCCMTGNVQSEYMLEFTLAKAVSCSSSSEMRIFVPYYLQCSFTNNNLNTWYSFNDSNNCISSAWCTEEQAETCHPILNKYATHNEIINSRADACAMNSDETQFEFNAEALWDYVGVSQRATDVCFPSLMEWDMVTHHENYTSLVNRISQYNLLERAQEDNFYFLQDMLAPSHELFANSALQSSNSNCEIVKENTMQHCTISDSRKVTKTCRCFAILAIDVIFESPSLPIYLLSAKVKIYKPEYDAENSHTIVPLLMEKHEKTRNTVNDNDLAEVNYATVSNNNNNNIDNDEDYDNSSNLESEFFRLFRDAEHWNYYVKQLQERMQSSHHSNISQNHEDNDRLSGNTNSNSDIVDNGVYGTVVQSDKMRFCVVATEMNDLVRTRDLLTKRGLPLELRHPELLSELPEVMTFVKQMREQMEREYNRQEIRSSNYYY